MAGRTLALFGLGGSGIATALALKAGGAEVLAWDDNAASLAKAEAQGIPTGDLRTADWSEFAALVLAPGVPLTHPEPHWTVKRAQTAGIEIIGDIELFCRERAKIAPHAPFIAITGTNGKSTTTALVAHILREAGRDVQMGGNIGTPILALAPPSNERVHVIELSSFQIDLAPSFGSPANPLRPPEEAGEASRLEGRTTAARASRRASGAPQHDAGGSLQSGSGPTIGVLLNITPDHLDRHGTMENYAAIKRRVRDSAEHAVLGGGDGATDLAGIDSLRGAHNAENAGAATSVCRLLGLSADSIEAGLRSFPGLHHRMEPLARRGRVLFINDSKATNADSTEKALLSFDHVFWIAGGKAKAGGIEALQPLFTKIGKAYLIGEATEAFAVTLEANRVPYSRCGTLDRAVAEAAADAVRSDSPESVVLLSPACASYDQYPNFEIRGDHFRELVRALPGVEMRT